jgi:DNA-directed RNA polymerase specialized sigma subunit
MDHQEWFEKYVKKLRFEEDCYISNPEALYEDWQALKITLLKMATDLLPGLEKRIINLIYSKGLSEREAAEKLNITRAKVQRKKKKAIKLGSFSFQMGNPTLL